MIKHNLVTPEMLHKALGYKERDNGHYESCKCKEIADKLNDLIHEKCLYCEEGDSGCQCWNDE